MIDNRIYTFLELCNVMNYHKTAENLNMTQPAVTQHIKYLENLYECKLFDYSNKKLSITKKGVELEGYARTIVSLNKTAHKELGKKNKIAINIGATKTIGEYILDEVLPELMLDTRYEIRVIVDNTERLLERLNHFDLDVLLLEGYVEKEKYHCENIRIAELVGICSANHSFAGKEVSLEEILNQPVVLREQGSGTRNVLENYLYNQGYSIEAFETKSILSSNRLIEGVVETGAAISFVYDVIPKKNEKLATFEMREDQILHEFNYVFLNEEVARRVISLIENQNRHFCTI